MVNRRHSAFSRSLVALAAVAAAAALPASAAAAPCAPPGNSGVEQYYETVPGAGCNESSRGHHPAHRHRPAGVSAATASALAADGPAGQAVLSLVASGPAATLATLLPSRPVPHAGATTSLHSPAGTPAPPAPSGTGSEVGPAPLARATAAGPVAGEAFPAALLTPLVSGSADAGGVGWLLPFTLGAALAVTVALLLRRAPGGPRLSPRWRTSSRTATPLAEGDATNLRPEMSPGCEQVESIHPREADHAKLHEPSGVREADAGCTVFREP